jgi:hypothetical protein
MTSVPVFISGIDVAPRSEPSFGAHLADTLSCNRSAAAPEVEVAVWNKWQRVKGEAASSVSSFKTAAPPWFFRVVATAKGHHRFQVASIKARRWTCAIPSTFTQTNEVHSI